MKQRDLVYDRKGQPLSVGFGEALWAFLLAAAIVMTCVGREAGAADAADGARGEIEDRLGIRIVGLRSSSAGYMLDFRYRVLDPVKAAPLLDRSVAPYLLDETTGARLGVPDAPKVGQLRPTSRNKIIPGRNYFMLFANPGRYLKPGSKVTLVAGDSRISHLTID